MDDDQLVQNAFRRLLENRGYEVEAVLDGASAVEQYRRRWESGRPFDIVLMDLTVPGGVGGNEALTRILQFDPKVRAVVCSGYSDNPVMANYREAGFVAALHKPFRVNDLETVIQNILSESENGISSRVADTKRIS